MRNCSVWRKKEPKRQKFAENSSKFFTSFVSFLPARYAIWTRTGERTWATARSGVGIGLPSIVQMTLYGVPVHLPAVQSHRIRIYRSVSIWSPERRGASSSILSRTRHARKNLKEEAREKEGRRRARLASGEEGKGERRCVVLHWRN